MAEKNRLKSREDIKNALSSVDNLVRDTRFSFYKRNPNLLVTNGGVLMMREKSTMEVIKQLGQAGQLSLIHSNDERRTPMEKNKRQIGIDQLKHRLEHMDF